MLLLSGITAVSAVPDAVAAILIMAVGMAIFSAPLAAVTMSALDETDQGVASAVNNVTGQLAGLLAVVLLPAATGLAGVRFSDPRFALGYGQTLLVLTVLAVARIPLAGWTFTAHRSATPTN